MEELTRKMEMYREAKLLCDTLETEIKAMIIESGQTAQATGIECVYKTGRKTYNYEKAGREHADESVIAQCTKSKTDWAAVCKQAGLVNIPFNEGKPTVSFCIKKDNPFPK